MAGESGERGSGLFASVKAGIGGIVAALRSLGNRERSKPSPPLARKQELPDFYGTSKVTLAVVDPYLIHAYWDIDPSRLPAGTSSAALRFHDLSGPPAAFFEVDVDLRARNWYVHLSNPAKSYYADLGVRTAHGEFTSLVVSNKVQTPRAWPASEIPRPEPEPAPPALAVAAAVAAPLAVKQAFTPAPLSEPVPERVIAPAAIEPLKPVDASHVLQQKLEEIYALRPWKSPPATTPEAVWPDELQPRVPTRPVASSFAFARIHGAAPLDLTALAERRFHPGLPSSPPG